jgi:hypothetical protein
LGTEVLKTSHEILRVSLRTPRKIAELSRSNEDVPEAENDPSKLLLAANASR